MASKKKFAKKIFPLSVNSINKKVIDSSEYKKHSTNGNQTAVKNAELYAKKLEYSINKIDNNHLPLISKTIRKEMVKRIQEKGIKNQKVLSVMEKIERHLFVETGLASQAYIDTALPIGHNQTISQPFIVAKMVEKLLGNKEKLNKVLEIGTGCGYQTAVLSCISSEVYSVERIKALHDLAVSNLKYLNNPRIKLFFGDGKLGVSKFSPFDSIILSAADIFVPQVLLDQMAIGGRLIAPIGNSEQVLNLISRDSETKWSYEKLDFCKFVPLLSGTF